MLVAFSVAPSGTGREDGSVSDAVAAAVRVVRESGLSNRTDAMFTTIEGDDWDEVVAVIRRATEAVAQYGSRVSLVLKADIRSGHTGGEMDGKVERLEAALRAPQAPRRATRRAGGTSTEITGSPARLGSSSSRGVSQGGHVKRLPASQRTLCTASGFDSD